MAIHVRRKRNVTPRFKPDMWGRDPGGEGEVLYDGTVTLDEYGEGTITLDEPMSPGHVVTLTYDGQDHEGIVKSSRDGIELVVMWGENASFTIDQNGVYMYGDDGNPITGDVSIKLVQGELPELDALFDGTVALTDGEFQGVPAKQGTFEASRELGDDELYFVIVDDVVKACTSSPNTMWADGAVMNVIGVQSGTTWLFASTDTTLTSQTLVVAVQNGGE